MPRVRVLQPPPPSFFPQEIKQERKISTLHVVTIVHSWHDVLGFLLQLATMKFLSIFKLPSVFLSSHPTATGFVQLSQAQAFGNASQTSC